MSDKDKRGAFTTVVISDIENNTQEVVYNSYTIPLLFYNGTNMSKLIEKIEAVPDKGIMIQNDIVFYESTYDSAEDTFEYVLITLNELEGSVTHSIAELIEDEFTLTPFINVGGGVKTAKVTMTNRYGNAIYVACPCIGGLDLDSADALYEIATSGEGSIDAILYKGKALLRALDASNPNVNPTYRLEGDAEYDDMINAVVITGDCKVKFITSSD